MKFFLTPLFILFLRIGFSQSLVVEYVQEGNLENSKDKNMLPPPIVSTLVINNHKSYHSYEEADNFINTLDEIQSAVENSSGDADNPKKIGIHLGWDPNSFTYKNFKENLYFEDAMLVLTKVKIHDNLPNIEWSIIPNETKKIGKYLCKKATALYRDELHIAWFTDEIPFSNGPHEFGGLPGLILRIETHETMISATKIINKPNDFTFDFPAIPAKKPNMLSLADFNKKEIEIMKKMQKDAESGTLIINLNQN